jgi:hypothetical protein
MHPQGSCTVCVHPQRKVIDEALASRTSSQRTLAKQYRLSQGALIRHKQAHLSAELVEIIKKDAGGDEESRVIDAEISRLKRAQKLADRRKDEDGKLKISRELRTWLELKAKLRAKRPLDGRDQQDAASPAEALQLAKDIIEMNLAGSQHGEIVSWLEAILERTVTTNSTTQAAKTTPEDGATA